jgi:hypothetical protein
MKKRFYERHEQMLEFQEKIKPFTPTLDELKVIWGLASRRVARYTIEKLLSESMVISRNGHYYAISRLTRAGADAPSAPELSQDSPADTLSNAERGSA